MDNRNSARLKLIFTLLLFGTIGAVQAAPRIQSHDYRAQVVLTDIETALTEYCASETEQNQVTGEPTNMIVREGDNDLLHFDDEKGQYPFLADNGDDELKIGKTYPYKLVFPAVAICLIVLSLNLLGDGLRDAFDPKLKR